MSEDIQIGQTFEVGILLKKVGPGWTDADVEFFQDSEKQNERRLLRLNRIYKRDMKPETGWIPFDGFMANLLVDVVELAKTDEVSWANKMKDEPGGNDFTMVLPKIVRAKWFHDANTRAPRNDAAARFGDLKYWGFLRQGPDDNVDARGKGPWWHRGVYQVRDFTYEFITDHSVTIPAKVRVGDSVVLERSKECVNFRDAAGSNWLNLSEWYYSRMQGPNRHKPSAQGVLGI